MEQTESKCAGCAACMQREQIALPAGITVENKNDCIQIKRHWFNWKIIPLMLFVIPVNLVSIIFILPIFFGTPESGIFMKTIVCLPLIACIYMDYHCAAHFFNVTIIRVTPERIKIRHWPLPWPGSRNMAVAGIGQVWCKQVLMLVNESIRQLYDVYVRMPDGQDIKLLSKLPKEEQALFIEQEIERFLDIKDQHVRGEVAR